MLRTTDWLTRHWLLTGALFLFGIALAAWWGADSSGGSARLGESLGGLVGGPPSGEDPASAEFRGHGASGGW